MLAPHQLPVNLLDLLVLAVRVLSQLALQSLHPLLRRGHRVVVRKLLLRRDPMHVILKQSCERLLT